MAPRVFLSYRGVDSNTAALVCKSLGRVLEIIRDIDDVVPGTDFRRWTEESIASCQVLVFILDEAGFERIDGRRTG